ncbi:hypothetical protein ACLB2K_075383 [Fragaria x ananassa]
MATMKTPLEGAEKFAHYFTSPIRSTEKLFYGEESVISVLVDLAGTQLENIKAYNRKILDTLEADDLNEVTLQEMSNHYLSFYKGMRSVNMKIDILRFHLAYRRCNVKDLVDRFVESVEDELQQFEEELEKSRFKVFQLVKKNKTDLFRLRLLPDSWKMNWTSSWRCLTKVYKAADSKCGSSLWSRQFRDKAKAPATEPELNRDFLVKLWMADEEMKRFRRKSRRRAVEPEEGSMIVKQPPVSQSISGYLKPESPEEVQVMPLLARSNMLVTRDIEWANLMLGFEQVTLSAFSLIVHLSLSPLVDGNRRRPSHLTDLRLLFSHSLFLSLSVSHIDSPPPGPPWAPVLHGSMAPP